MRIDLLLKYLCLVKSRSQARRGCDEGAIKLNGRRVSAHKEVKVGDVIEVSYPSKELVVSIKEIPLRQISKKDRELYYSVIRERKKDRGVDL